MLLNHFCSRWTSKYLTELRENQRLSNRNKTLILPKVNDVVLIKDDNYKRADSVYRVYLEKIQSG